MKHFLDVDQAELIREKELHDSDKLQPGRLELFALRHGITTGMIDFAGLPHHIFNLIKNALLDHVTHNDHHLEYFATRPVVKFFKFDKTKVDIVPVKPIPVQPNDTGIVKACCDWCAVSATLNSDPRQYADYALKKRFSLPKETQQKFRSILSTLWK